MERRHALLALGGAALAAGAALSHLGTARATPRDSLLLAAPDAMAQLNEQLAYAFKRLTPGAEAWIEVGCALSALLALERRAIDIAALPRALDADEDGPAIRSYMVARCSVIVVVHAALAITALQLPQLRALYAGAIEDWAQLGAAPGPVKLTTLPARSHHGSCIERTVMGETGVSVRALEVADAPAMVARVAGEPGTIGFLPLSSNRPGDGLCALAIDGVPATRATALSGRYALVDSLHLVVNDRATPLTHAFVAFARSAQAHPVFVQQQLLPVT